MHTPRHKNLSSNNTLSILTKKGTQHQLKRRSKKWSATYYMLHVYSACRPTCRQVTFGRAYPALKRDPLSSRMSASSDSWALHFDLVIWILDIDSVFIRCCCFTPCVKSYLPEILAIQFIIFCWRGLHKLEKFVNCVTLLRQTAKA